MLKYGQYKGNKTLEKFNTEERKMERKVYDSREVQLVDVLVGILFKDNSPEIKTLVGHRFPDDDALLCCWIAKKFIPKAANATIVFVNAGESLPGTENDPSVLHFDTGHGEYDQHGTKSWRMSSAQILVKKLEEKFKIKEPALNPLLELAAAVDNIKPLPSTSIHFIIEGYPRMFRNGNGQIDWQEVQSHVFELFEIIYNQEKQRIQGREDLRRFAEWTTLPNGIKVAALLGHPELREAAFEAGATVVVWTQPKGNGKFYTGIQRHRDSEIRLDGVAGALRFADSREREINVQGRNLRYIGQTTELPWYLHDSLGLILNGSRSRKLEKEEFTKLQHRQILGIVHQSLSNIPKGAVTTTQR
jgi:hypothetical protein